MPNSSFSGRFRKRSDASSRARPANRRRSRLRRLLFSRRTLFWGAAVVLALGLVGAIALMIFLRPYAKRAREFDLARVADVEKASTVLDREGRVIGTIFTENRRPVPLEALPEHLLNALVATEDSRFYRHRGFDPIGIARAAVRNFTSGRVAEGASTITQQLARQTFELREISYERKIIEILIARRIEKVYSKKEILQHYLNLIYFGNGFYGIEAAALGYFGKPAAELSIGEAAALVGLIKRPNAYNPFDSLELATETRNRSLDRMLDQGFITREQHDQAVAKPLEPLPPEQRGGRQYHVMGEVRRRIEAILANSQASRDGLRIHTTLDLDLEDATRRAILGRLSDYETARAGAGKPPLPDRLESAAVVIDNLTGDVLAAVGGRDFDHSEFDRAFRASRAAGTAFTPFVYAAAIEAGTDPYETVLDIELDNREVMVGAFEGIVGEWGAESELNEYEGEISAWEAIVYSKNGATVRLGQMVGVPPVLELARKAGITSELNEAPATFLGQTEVTPVEFAFAFTAIPNGGQRPFAIHLIAKVVAEDGRVIYEKPDQTRYLPVMKPRTAGHVHSALAEALEIGTGRAALDSLDLSHMPAGGKTGTAYNFTDAWFVGYNSQVTCAVWTGFDTPAPIAEDAFGSTLALPIWVDVMNASARDLPPDQIPPPPGCEAVFLCDRSGMKATRFCAEHRHVPAVSDEPLLVMSSHRDYLTPLEIDRLEDCAFHTADGLSDEIKIHPKGGGQPPRAAIAFARPVYPISATLEGDDPFGTLAAPEVRHAAPVEEEEESPPPRPEIVAPPAASTAWGNDRPTRGAAPRPGWEWQPSDVPYGPATAPSSSGTGSEPPPRAIPVDPTTPPGGDQRPPRAIPLRPGAFPP